MGLVIGFNFDRNEDQQRALVHIKQSKPMIIIGSPECTMCSTLQNLNKDEDSPEWNENMKEARQHVRFVVNVYKY